MGELGRSVPLRDRLGLDSGLSEWPIFVASAVLLASLPWTWAWRDALRPALPLPWTVLPFAFFIMIVGVATAKRDPLKARWPGAVRVMTNPWTYAGLLGVWSVISILLSSSRRESAEWAIQFAAVVLTFWLLRGVLLPPQRLKTLLCVFILSASLCGLAGMWHTYSTLSTVAYLRPFLGLLDPNSINAVFVIALAGAMFLWCQSEVGFRLVGAIGIVIPTLLIGFSGARGGVLGAAVVLIAATALGAAKRLRLSRAMFGLLLSSISLACALLTTKVVLQIGSSPGAAIPSVAETDSAMRLLDYSPSMMSNTGFRLEIWRTYLSLFQEWLPTGFGPGIDYQVLEARGFGAFDTHNVLLQSLIQLGIPGLILVLAAGVFFFRAALKPGPRAAGLLMMLGLAPVAMTVGILSLAVAWMPLAFATVDQEE